MKVDLNALSQRVVVDDVFTKYALTNASTIFKELNPYFKIGTSSEDVIRKVHPILVTFINNAFDRDDVEDELLTFLYENALIIIIDEYIGWHKRIRISGDTTNQFLFRDNNPHIGPIFSLHREVVNNIKLRLFNLFLDSFNETKISIIINTFLNTTDKSRTEIKNALKSLIISKIELSLMFIIKGYSRLINKQNIHDYCVVRLQELKYDFISKKQKKKQPEKKEK